MSIVEEYWSGIARRLQIESGVLNNLIPHSVTKGTENELALARVIENVLPPSIGVGSGIVFDHLGGTSRQSDIILFDKAVQPQLMAQSNQVMFPIETVKMVLEVKTSLRATDIETDLLAKRKDLYKLQPLEGFQIPPFGLFAYSFADSDYGRAKELSDLRGIGRPDLACIVHPGFVTDGATSGFVPLMSGDEGGHDSPW